MAHKEMKAIGIIGGALAGALLLSASPARADAIDGNWCSDDGRRFTIEGPRIVTPKGTRTTGDYDRHAFRYTVPAADPGAGTEIAMNLLDEYTLQLWAGARTADDKGEIWHRCGPETS